MHIKSMPLVVASSALVLGLMTASPAEAHPHVWVTAETTIVFDKGSISGLRHKWTFDEMYTEMAVQGLDTNKDGIYDRQELAELAQVNMDGLKEFDYFTYVLLDGKRLKTKPPVDYYLERSKEGLLSLYFTVPLNQPVLTDAKGFAFQVTDPGGFIAFDFAKDDPIKVAPGAPAGCKGALLADDQASDDAKKMGETFLQAMGGGSMGVTVARTGTLVCK